MKRLVTFLLLLLSLAVKGQDDRPHFFADGRSWKYEYSLPDYGHMTEEQILNGTYNWLHVDYVLHVEGDTVADGRACRKIVASGPWGVYLYALGAEEQGKVMLCLQREEPAFYAPFPVNEWVTLYDFNVAKSSHCHMAAFPGGDVIVSSEGTIQVDGIPCRFIVLSNEDETSWQGYAIEGIGCPGGLYMFENIITNGSSSSFIGCYDGDCCIVSIEDFDNLPSVVASKKCATPTIAYDKGRLVFSCKTEGAECVYEIKCADTCSGRGGEVSLGQTYEIRVHATLDGYEDSDVAVATIGWHNGRPVMEGFSSIMMGEGDGMADVNGDGKVDVADIATVISIMAGQSSE